MANCKVCGKEIHPKRVALGYKTTCVNHSTAERFSAVISGNGKNDYEVHIIKDPDVARHLVELSNVYGK